MNLTVTGHHICGETAIIASKSNLHRLLICAALSKTPTIIKNATVSKDILATVDCLRAFAADINIDNDTITVLPFDTLKANPTLNCNESGSTLRFLLPIVAALGIGGSFTGCGRLSERPLSPLYELLSDNGCKLSPQGAFPLNIEGQLKGDLFEINGDTSSQFISGLLFAAPLLGNDCTIKINGNVESYPYIEMTLNTMKIFGINVVEVSPFTYKIASNSNYISPKNVVAEGDWSNAAFWLVAAGITKSYDFVLSNLNHSSLQGDKTILSILQKSGIKFKADGNKLKITEAEQLSPLQIDASQTPDLVPILSVFACAINGQTKIYNAKRLIYKESNRLQTVCEMISSLGGKIKITDDALTIDGTGRLKGGTVNSYNDHRIAMSAAVASFICDKPVTIIDTEATEKSYPDFYNEFQAKGMIICPPSETD